MRPSLEISIDLTAQDLLSLPGAAAPNVPHAAEDDTVEIELTADQMDAMLSAK